ncbi:MAG: hypothetical protein LBV42_04350 [Methanobrevibacter sp.]|nr:hypothetical protein [Methanobrevibacter sp.]
MARHQKIINETLESDRLKEMMNFLWDEFIEVKNKMKPLDKIKQVDDYESLLNESLSIIKAFEFLTRNCSSPKENKKEVAGESITAKLVRLKQNEK